MERFLSLGVGEGRGFEIESRIKEKLAREQVLVQDSTESQRATIKIYFFIYHGDKITEIYVIKRGFPVGSVVKNLPANPANAGNMGLIPGSERSSVLLWEILWKKVPGRLQSMGISKSHIYLVMK